MNYLKTDESARSGTMKKSTDKKLIMVTHRFPMLSETFILAHVEGLRDCLVKIIPTTLNEKGEELYSDVEKLEPINPDPPLPGYLHQPWLKIRWKLQRRAAHFAYAWAPDVQDRLLRMICESGGNHLFFEYGTVAAWCYPAIVKSRLPFTIHFHGLDAASSLRSEAYRACLTRMLPQADHVIVVGEAMQARLNEIAPTARYLKIPYGVKFAPQVMTNGRQVGLCRLLSVGRLVEKKAPLVLLAAVAEAHSKAQSQIQLTMIGDGPLMPQVIDYLKAHRMEPYVRVLGSQSHKDVLKYMSDVDIFVQHSVVAQDGDREGNPVAVMEALAAGLPVVATRHEGIRESVIEGQSGLLVDEHDMAGMADAIVRLADSPKMRERFGKFAAGHAREHFSEANRIGQLREALDLPPLAAADTVES